MKCRRNIDEMHKVDRRKFWTKNGKIRKSQKKKHKSNYK